MLSLTIPQQYKCIQLANRRIPTQSPLARRCPRDSSGGATARSPLFTPPPFLYSLPLSLPLTSTSAAVTTDPRQPVLRVAPQVALGKLMSPLRSCPSGFPCHIWLLPWWHRVLLKKGAPVFLCCWCRELAVLFGTVARGFKSYKTSDLTHSNMYQLVLNVREIYGLKCKKHPQLTHVIVACMCTLYTEPATSCKAITHLMPPPACGSSWTTTAPLRDHTSQNTVILFNLSAKHTAPGIPCTFSIQAVSYFAPQAVELISVASADCTDAYHFAS